jgi:hypothetical protein
MSVPTGTALYYPYIHVRTPDQLKSALLYWDRVRRIVPPSVQTGNYAYEDDADSRLLADNDLLIATSPGPYETVAADQFLSHIEPQSPKFRIDEVAARDLANNNRGIHIEKLGGNVLYKLQQMGLAHRFGDWVSMHDSVGAFYMFCLASEMAKQMDAPLMADSNQDAELGQSLLFEPTATADITDMLLDLTVDLPHEKQLHDISMKTIATFARKHAAERKRFRDAVENILNTARSNPDPNALADFLNSKRKEIDEAVSDHRKTLDELHVGGVSGAAKLTVPAGFAAGLAAYPISPMAASILAGLGLIVGGISVYAETRGKLRQAKRSSPYHYLLSIEKKFGSKKSRR